MHVNWALVIFCVCPSFPFGITEGGMWNEIELFPDHCLSIYLTMSDGKDFMYLNICHSLYRIL